ncbi:sodium:proton antiporter [Kribbella pittospori]|uniref:Na(+)/H(+) antiporter NhaA n=1 Tax=Kribbella pittospori TaxID=722689 RepID=A0A4R0KTQ5_9ACTN|nr:Na+/H+ antiporter NhaA [Kribbella pittospori]TCC62914.1 sodium:proton antiporter [Kribbella pittospori]
MKPKDPADLPMSMVGPATSPLRAFLRTEAASAAILAAAIVLALIWANVATEQYDAFWDWVLAIRLGPWAAELDLRTWVNSGLMALFFLVVGLEARREFDLGELRERRRMILPVTAGLAGMLIPVLIYLAINRSGTGVHGWGAAMSTDTALALGVFAVAGKHVPDRIRTFLLTVFVVDDVVALLVIAVAYTSEIHLTGLLVAIAAYAGVLASTRLGYRYRRPVFTVLALVVWAGLLASGIDPVVAGLAVGLATSAYVPRRDALEQATTLVRLFREQPTPELAREATRELTGTLSANARLQHAFHRLTSYVIVPLFALANAGIVIDADLLKAALTAPVTVGIFVAFVVGKPIAVAGTSWILTRSTHGAVRPSVGWAGVLGSGMISGVPFTVSLLIADLAFTGPTLEEAKLGVLAAAIGAAVLSVSFYRLIGLLPVRTRTRALLGAATLPIDLAPPVDPSRDHIRGPAEATVTVVEYGDFECPWTQMAAPTARELLAENSHIRYVWRHLPLPDVHPHAQLAAEAAEAASRQGMFWQMHDVLLTNQQNLELDDLLGYAADLGLDVDRFREDLVEHDHTTRVAQDVDSADRSGVAGTPTFFINDHRHDGPQDLPVLNQAIQLAYDQQLATST